MVTRAACVRLGGSAADEPEVFAGYMRLALASCVRATQAEAERGTLPSLYANARRIEWRDEPTAGSGVEFIDDPFVVLARGYGDCDDLACWRVAELRARGERANVAIKWNGKRYHALVRRENGKLEDPSRVLGMGR